MKTLKNLLKHPKIYALELYYDDVEDVFYGKVTWTNHLGVTCSKKEINKVVEELILLE